MTTKKGTTTYLFFSCSLLLLGHPGSGIRYPAWKKSGSWICDKHPEFANPSLTFTRLELNDPEPGGQEFTDLKAGYEEAVVPVNSTPVISGLNGKTREITSSQGQEEILFAISFRCPVLLSSLSFLSRLTFGMAPNLTICTGNITTRTKRVKSSVADPGSGAFLTTGSGIQDLESGIGFFRIPDPKPIFLRT